jgi:hypothetical protein
MQQHLSPITVLSPCEALSSKGSEFSSIEVWCPGYKVTPYKIPVLKETEGVHTGYYKEQRDLLEQISLTVKMNNDSCLKSMDERKSSQRKLDSLR